MIQPVQRGRCSAPRSRVLAGLLCLALAASPAVAAARDLPDGGKLYHVDCYRLQDAVAEAATLGLEELFDQGIVLIEWADRIAPLLPERRLDIELLDAGPGHRRISLIDSREPSAAVPKKIAVSA